MDNLTLAQKLLGKEQNTESKSQAVSQSGASLVYMVAVTSSSNGEVVLMPEVEATEDWEGEDIIEIDEDGDYDDWESDDDPLEGIDDSVLDMTDGDGVDIDEASGETVAFTVTDYHEAAAAAYLSEGDVEEELLPDEDTVIGDDIDDGDANELPDVGEAEEDDLAGEDSEIADTSDADYTPTDDNSYDESDDPIDGAEISDGYTTAECIGTVKAGDRVMVAIQDGKMCVIGVVGSGDEEEALRQQAQETADEATAAADAAQLDAEQAKQAAEETKAATQEAERQAQAALNAATSAEAAAGQAKTEAEEAAAKAEEAKVKAESAIADLSVMTKEVNTVKEDAAQLRTDLEGQIETVRTTAEQTFSTKTELSEAQTTLRKEITDSIAGIQATFAQDYAKKTEVDGAIADVKADLQSQIMVNASGISTVVKSVEETQVTITDQNGKIANAIQTATDAATAANQAKTDASEAQTAADQAKAQATAANTAATAAQTAANEANTKAQQAEREVSEAKENLANAEAKLDELEENAAASAEDIAQAQAAVQAAQQAVQTAQSAANQAKADAATAQSTADQAKADAAAADAAAATAQSTADTAKANAATAQAAADKAQEDVNTLEKRVETCESGITELSDSVTIFSTKLTEDYYTKTQTEAKIKTASDSITSTVSSTYLSKTDASTTYSTKLEVTQTATNLTALITTAQNTADNAAKTATNYLNFGSSGLVVGDMTASTLGRNVLIGSDRVDIRSGTNVLASYQDNAIYLGLDNSVITTIDFCNGMAIFSTYDDGDDWNRLVVTSEYGMYYVTQGEIKHTAAYSPDYGQTELYASIDLLAQRPWGGSDTKFPSVTITAACTNVVTSTKDDDYYSKIQVSQDLILMESYGDSQDLAMVRIDGDDCTMLLQAWKLTFHTAGGRDLLTLDDYNAKIIVDTEIGERTGYNDGKDGIHLDADGFIQIQRNNTSYHPYIGFYLNGSTDTADGQIRVNQSNGYMQFLQSDRYTFDNVLESTGAIITNASLRTGGKGNANDGKAGCILTNTGNLYLQHTTGNPTVYFYGEGQTASGATIYYTVSDDSVRFGGATRYVFSNIVQATAVQVTGNVMIGNDDTASSLSDRSINTKWKDGSSHYLAYRDSDGLTSAFGWAGSSSYATVTKIRGRTCQYQNASGTSTLSDERLKKDFVSLDRWDGFFDSLVPFAFKMKTGSSGRYHFGFKAQEFEKALLDNGMTTQDCAAFVRLTYQPDEDDPEGNAVFEAAGIKAGDYYYGIIYTELTPLNTYQIQNLKAEVKELKAEIQKMKNAS